MRLEAPMRMTPALFALSLAVATPGALAAQDVAFAADPQSLVDEIKALGHDARLDPCESGRPRIRSRIVGVDYSLAFYGCLDDMTDCRG